MRNLDPNSKAGVLRYALLTVPDPALASTHHFCGADCLKKWVELDL
jgi:hypothetical protein